MNTSSLLRKAACAVAFSVCVTAPTFAIDSGFYLGASIGQSKYDVVNETSGLFESTSGPGTDDTDTGFALAFGYRINPYIGVEFSFSDLGDLAFREYGGTTVTRLTATPNTRPAYGLVDTSAGSKGYNLSAIGSLPLGNFELFGKVGAMYAKTTLDTAVYTTSIDTAAPCVTGCTWVFPNAGRTVTSDETTEVLYAVGAGYTLAEVVFIKVEWMRIPDLGDEDVTGETDVDNISLGFQYRF